MYRKSKGAFIIFIFLFSGATFLVAQKAKDVDRRIVSYVADPKKQHLQFYWRDDQQQNFGNFLRLKNWLELHGQTLLFAMNGGMYTPGNSPKGLFIENGTMVVPLDTSSGSGNFYLKPNGVLYITTDNTPVVCSTSDFTYNGKIKYATQSGPMLLTDGKINRAFTQGSTNLNIRNGVGILPDNKILFAISTEEISFYDFAAYFKNMGCLNALYLDGFVSRIYLPGKNQLQADDNFGVIIAVTNP